MMRTCLLQAGLSRASGSADFVLGNPRSWLGSAYHEVLEKIVDINLEQESLEAAVERLWNEAIKPQQNRAELHALDHRFGGPSSWPGYHLARASVLIRAEEIVSRNEPARAPNTTQALGAGSARTIRERQLTAFGGKLHGRPDVIRSNEVVDYKSGAIVEHDAAAQTEIVKVAFVRQLRIYGYLAKQEFGWWPPRGILLPLGGAGLEVRLVPAECEREASEAVALLDAYNAKVHADAAIEEFASPSPQACCWCTYKLLCPIFWRSASPLWSGYLDGAAVEGPVAGSPIVIHAGAARAITVDIQAGTEERCRVQIAPLSQTIHPTATTILTSERVRLVGLAARPDNVLVPTQRTVLARVVDLPSIVVAKGVPAA
jgi:hypothetical protein